MKNRKQAIASKTTMNLAVRERKFNPAILIPALVLILAAAAALGKFGVADRLAAVNTAQSEVNAMQSRLAEIRGQYTDIDAVQAEYARYTYRDFDRSIADRLDVMSLLERRVFPVCAVQDMVVGGRQLSLTLGGLSLEQTSALIASLEEDALVDRVSVSTYTTEKDGSSVSVTQMNIALASAEEGGNA